MMYTGCLEYVKSKSQTKLSELVWATGYIALLCMH